MLSMAGLLDLGYYQALFLLQRNVMLSDASFFSQQMKWNLVRVEVNI